MLTLRTINDIHNYFENALNCKNMKILSTSSRRIMLEYKKFRKINHDEFINIKEFLPMHIEQMIVIRRLPLFNIKVEEVAF